MLLLGFLLATLSLFYCCVEAFPNLSQHEYGIFRLTKRAPTQFTCGSYTVQLPDEEEQDVLGEGYFGTVIKTQAIRGNGAWRSIALKIGNGRNNMVAGNTDAKSKLSGNPNGVDVLAACTVGGVGYVVLELLREAVTIDTMTGWGWFTKDSEWLLRNTARDASKAVQYIHDRQRVHGDVSRVNLVLVPNGNEAICSVNDPMTVKIIDYDDVQRATVENIAKDVRALAITIIAMMMSGEHDLTDFEDVSFTTQSYQQKYSAIQATMPNASHKLIEFLAAYIFVPAGQCYSAATLEQAFARTDFPIFA
ncbi:hypothetical protein BDV95DRAFT_235947 [Massariosphaeria phaeospora]|uniref:Protein kinase domain-containing protein n=1 Tax=Massariosphaeria phaeospora TaxID=100035 RepID=A0A7C8IHV7_9PLEO|nr:hypothetical protein BDV95DRAFT_235947 [Massariosphaeria phaeospora]